MTTDVIFIYNNKKLLEGARGRVIKNIPIEYVFYYINNTYFFVKLPIDCIEIEEKIEDPYKYVPLLINGVKDKVMHDFLARDIIVLDREKKLAVLDLNTKPMNFLYKFVVLSQYSGDTAEMLSVQEHLKNELMKMNAHLEMKAFTLPRIKTEEEEEKNDSCIIS